MERTIKFAVERSVNINDCVIDHERMLIIAYDIEPAEPMSHDSPGYAESIEMTSAIPEEGRQSELHLLSDSEYDRALDQCWEDWREFQAMEQAKIGAAAEDAFDAQQEQRRQEA